MPAEEAAAALPPPATTMTMTTMTRMTTITMKMTMIKVYSQRMSILTLVERAGIRSLLKAVHDTTEPWILI